MNDKKETTLKGTLIYPLALGCCALIFNRGRFIRTFRVVAIHSQTAEELCFETLNTRYTLLFPGDRGVSGADGHGRVSDTVN